MSKRKNYYQYEKSYTDKPFESVSKFDHQGPMIKIKDIPDLENLATDYICTKRAGTYFEAFEMVLKIIDKFKQQSRAIDQIQKNYTV